MKCFRSSKGFNTTRDFSLWLSWRFRCFMSFEGFNGWRGIKVLICYIGFKGLKCFKGLNISHYLYHKNGLMLNYSSKVSNVSSVYRVSTVSRFDLIYISRTSCNNYERYKCFKALTVSRVWSVPIIRAKIKGFRAFKCFRICRYSELKNKL